MTLQINDRAEAVVRKYVTAFIKNNRPARILEKDLSSIGIGIWPLVDHITVRTTDVNRRSQEFTALGFEWDEKQGKNGILAYDDWWAKVYRKTGLPALFVDQAFEGRRGETSVIPPWVKNFSDKILHHIAVRVDDIEAAVSKMQRLGIKFAGKIVGKRGSDLRQVFTAADVKKGSPFTVLEIIERHRGYDGFQPPQADSLMKSSVMTAKTRITR